MRIHHSKLALISSISIIAICLISLFSYCEKDQTIITPSTELSISAPEQTADGLETAAPVDEGMDVAPLIEMREYLRKQNNHNIHAILIIKNQKLVYEQYFRGHAFLYNGPGFLGEEVDFSRETMQALHSVSKSFTSICVGLALDRRLINSIEDTLFNFFPQYTHLRTPQKEQILLKHLLTMTSGFEWNEWDVSLGNTSNDIVRLWNVNDPLAYVLAKPLVNAPGTSFYYNGGNTHLLGEIVRKTSHQTLHWFAKFYLFTPLGITESQWGSFPNGVIDAGGGLLLRPRDMAKIGFLFLNKGIWKGDRIISEEWIIESTTPYIQLPWLTWAEGYAYQWWIKSYRIGTHHIPVYFASGWGGQNIIVLKSLDMVVIFTGSNYTSADPGDYLMNNYILPAVLLDNL